MTPINPQDSLFLLFESGTNPMHVAGLNIYTPPPSAGGTGCTFVADIIRTWSKHTAAKAPFNLRPVKKLGRWFWEEEPDFDIDYHLRHLSLPKPGRIRELLSMVSRLHATPLDRNRPLWEVYVIEGLEDGRFATYIKFHHSLLDGVTGMRLMASFMSPDAAPHKQKLPFWAMEHKHRAASASTGASTTLKQKMLDALQGTKGAMPGLARGAYDIARSMAGSDAKGLPFQGPPSMFNVKITGSRRFVAQSYPLADFKALAKLGNATVNDIVLAVCAGAVRRYLLSHDALPDKSLVSMVPVSLHSQGGEGGNSIAMVTTSLATDTANPLERLQRIKDSMVEVKERLRDMNKAEKVAYTAITLQAPAIPLMLTGIIKHTPLYNVTVSNVPGSAQPLYLHGARLDETYPVSIPLDYVALNITVTSYGDNFGFGYIACRRSVPGLQRMIDHTEAALDELRKALGLKKTVVKKVAAKIATTPATKAPAKVRAPVKKTVAKPPVKSPVKPATKKIAATPRKK